MNSQKVISMLRFLLASLCLLALPARAGPVDQALLAGTWRGEGRFYEVKLLRATAPPLFELSIAPDLTLTGTVGGARISPARPTAVGKRIDYEVLLDGPAGPGKFLEGKDHLVILITAMDGNSLSADFHLKSRFGFDIGMHPGSLEAARTDGE